MTASAGILVPALSGGRRRHARPVSGSAGAFATDLTVVYYPLPVPAPPGMAPLACLTAGLVLQSAPTKERVAALAIEELDERGRRALQLAEGAAALAWAMESWPGLESDLRRLTGGLDPTRADAGGDELLDAARALAASRRRLDVPDILGRLPGVRPLSAKVPWSTRVRATARLPWSRPEIRKRSRTSVPVGGSGGEQAPRSGPPPSTEPDEEHSRDDRRIGIPYPEWDVHRGAYRPDHVAVLELRTPLPAGPPSPTTPALVRWFRQTPTRVWHGRLPDGTDLDLGAFVEQHCRLATGEEIDGRVYAAIAPGQRDVATALLLDASSSLQVRGGRAFDLELDCADALVGAMTCTGERFAVFAFAGETRHRVEVRVLRDFDDPPGPLPRGSGLVPRGYTRLGAPIRHVTRRLAAVPAERRILVSIGDGLPSDEGYEGHYAEADVARAVAEAHSQGVFVYHVGVGRAVRDPLPRCFGPQRSQRIRNLEALPGVLARVHEGLVDP
ncbi:MAG: nitric oxide reductase activation protein NorD [Acidimicrobiia bacterium]